MLSRTSGNTTVCPECRGTKVRRDRLAGYPGQWLERVCAICQGRGWLDLHQLDNLMEQGIVQEAASSGTLLAGGRARSSP
jgi:Zn-finger nucleic acid-binding protein